MRKVWTVLASLKMVSRWSQDGLKMVSTWDIWLIPRGDLMRPRLFMFWNSWEFFNLLIYPIWEILGSSRSLSLRLVKIFLVNAETKKSLIKKRNLDSIFSLANLDIKSFWQMQTFPFILTISLETCQVGKIEHNESNWQLMYSRMVKHKIQQSPSGYPVCKLLTQQMIPRVPLPILMPMYLSSWIRCNQ